LRRHSSALHTLHRLHLQEVESTVIQQKKVKTYTIYPV
jgi:hypothetical protein